MLTFRDRPLEKLGGGGIFESQEFFFLCFLGLRFLGCLENNDLEKYDLENDDLENYDLENEVELESNLIVV